MESITGVAKDGRWRGKMGKLFKDKEKKDLEEPTNQNDVDDFLRGPSDKLQMMPSAPSPSFAPQLARIDTGRSARWPTATEVQTVRRRRSASPKRSRKGLVVRFTDEQPEVIGEGGDEALSPVTEIRARIRSHTHPLASQKDQNTAERPENTAPKYGQPFESQSSTDNFRPGLMRRTQTGFDSIPDIPDKSRSRPEASSIPALHVLGDARAGDNRSFAEMVKEDMRSGEGLALVKPQAGGDADMIRQMEEVQLNTRRNSHIPPISDPTPQHSATQSYMSNSPRTSAHLTESPATLSRPSPMKKTPSYQSSYHASESPATASRPSPMEKTPSFQNSYHASESSATSKTSSFAGHSGYQTPNTQTRDNSPTLTLQETAAAVDDALRDFSARTSHLFNLFRLSSESVKPLSTYPLEDLMRAAFWWFIKGRCQLESTLRERPSSAEAQKMCHLMRQQSHADLAKSLWLSETVISQRLNDSGQANTNEILDCKQVILSSLRKIAVSMKRNNILPPEGRDAPLNPGLDASIWTPDDGNRSLLGSQSTTSVPYLSEAYPLGDTSQTFHFGRVFADAILVEDAASQQYRCPVLLSMIRAQNEHSMSIIIVNQNSTLNVLIKSDKSRGTTWNHVRWQAKLNTIEITLPRGFLLRVRFSEQDFRLLLGTYDHEMRTHAMLSTKDGEELVFETSLKAFQCFNQIPSTGLPKEPQPDCHLRIFETSIIQRGATGPRKMHRGFRYALNTNPKTKLLRGIDQVLLPNFPIQFGFLRGDGATAAFLLKSEDDRSKFTIVNTFEHAEDRTRIHELLNGSALGEGEDVVAKAQMNGMSIVTSDNASVHNLRTLEWQNFKVINTDEGSLQHNKTVLSHHLRVVLDFKTGTLTDRINVGPGELKIRLDVNSQTSLKILRQSQQDLTLAISEAQVPKELPRELAKLLDVMERSETTRQYDFPSIKELHLFQAAVTGFEVLFDGVAASFNISRRRMVVPIYKKWDAASTRVQIVQKEKIIQLVAFFENFSHGDCMNFTLKTTDVFETSGRSGKGFSVKIDDAKFAMPKVKSEDAAVGHEFVCLDMPEYPGEHDDITIVFDTEASTFIIPLNNDLLLTTTVRDLFTTALPAPAKAGSRMGNLGSIRR